MRPVLDFSTLDRRRMALAEELRVNRELAPGVGLRLRAIVALSDSYSLVDAPASGAVEYAIEMRRFDETRTVAALADDATARRVLAGRALHRAAAIKREQAGDLLVLAERLAWRARGPLAISGPPASGKSTLAAALSRRSGWPALSSDILRKRRRGMEPTATAPDADYTLDARAAIYRELGEHARDVLADESGTIIDATFGDPQLRHAFLERLGGQHPMCALKYWKPAPLREDRARERLPTSAGGSDAAPAVVARLGASFSD